MRDQTQVRKPLVSDQHLRSRSVWCLRIREASGWQREMFETSPHRIDKEVEEENNDLL